MKIFSYKMSGFDLSVFSGLYASVSLTHEDRARCRMQIQLDNGEIAGLHLRRTERLQPGDVIGCDEGDCILVKAREEPLFEVCATAPLDLARAAYHLGNRHVAVEFVNALTLRFPADPVLAEMLRGMGLHVVETCAAFMPERGAYGQLPHSHEHHSHEAESREPDLFDPGHGAHRTARKIHDFTDK